MLFDRGLGMFEVQVVHCPSGMALDHCGVAGLTSAVGFRLASSQSLQAAYLIMNKEWCNVVGTIL